MKDWEDILESIERAMQSGEKAQQDPHPGPEAAKVDRFRTQMEGLGKDLAALKNILDHADAYAEEQLSNALSRLRTGKSSDYHRVPRVAKGGHKP